MSAPDDLGFLTNDNLPSREAIVAMCKEAGYKCRGIPLRNQPSGPIIAWIKYGGDVEMAEALTQDWVAKFLDANPGAGVRAPRVYMAFLSDDPKFRIGCIVMEYIGAPDCDEGDDQLVATAVQTLISITGPKSMPGPVGGGRVIHNFFMEWRSAITYDTVEELEQHMNGILKHRGDTRRVNLVANACAGLRLCPCDINPGNFKKYPDSTVVALDFGATCFLPPSFFAVAMRKAIGSFASWANFAEKVAKRVSYPMSSDVEAMVAASYHLVPFGRNDIGLPRNLRQRKGL